MRTDSCSKYACLRFPAARRTAITARMPSCVCEESCSLQSLVATIFFARFRASLKPNDISMISPIMASGTIMATVLKRTFKLSGSSARPAPGFMVMNTAHDLISCRWLPSKSNSVLPSCTLRICMICCATTDRTSKSIRLNSSKQAQAPQLATPLKNLPICKSKPSEQLNTTQFETALAK
eukprot:10219_5